MRYRLLLLLMGLAILLLLAVPAQAGDGYGPKEMHILVRDSIFDPAVVRVTPGTTVVWHFEGRNPHSVQADDGSWDSGIMKRGQTFSMKFDQPGRYAFYCKPHGGAGGKGMSGVILVGDVADTGGVREVKVRRQTPITIRVPDDYKTIQEAVDEAHPGDMVLIAPGVYHETVTVMTPEITIRGLDRNKVILDGEFRRDNGIKVLGADGVVVENMTARHYTLNGFYWTGVKGYRGSYLTAYNNGDYGVYAFDSMYGQLDNSYASGHPDSGFYIGQCKPCHALITNVISEYNALGYSGTNAGGDLTIRDSVWQYNMAGLVPNTLDTERLPPQTGTRIVNNIIRSNNYKEAAAKALAYPSFGSGIIIAGGVSNVVEGNQISDHDQFGILVVPNVDKNFWISEGNVVRSNRISDSRRADLGLAAPAGAGNCFEGNAITSSQPPLIHTLYACGAPMSKMGGGEMTITATMLAKVFKAHAVGDYKTQPVPKEQPNMPDIQGAPAPAWPTPESQVQVTASASGVALAVVPWWVSLFGLYAYLLPFVLYASWVAIALWDLFRRDDRTMGFKLGWMAAILLVPGVGPVAYHLFFARAIPRPLRYGLIFGGLAAYFFVAFLGVSLGQ